MVVVVVVVVVMMIVAMMVVVVMLVGIYRVRRWWLQRIITTVLFDVPIAYRVFSQGRSCKTSEPPTRSL